MSETARTRLTVNAKGILTCLAILVQSASLFSVMAYNDCFNAVTPEHLRYLDEMIDSQLLINNCTNVKIAQLKKGITGMSDECFIRGSVLQLYDIFENVKFKENTNHSGRAAVLFSLLKNKITHCMGLSGETVFMEIPPQCKSTDCVNPTDMLKTVKKLFEMAQNFMNNHQSDFEDCDKYFDTCEESEMTQLGSPHCENTSPIISAHPVTTNQKPQSGLSATNHTSHSTMSMSLNSAGTFHHMLTSPPGISQTTESSSVPETTIEIENPHTDIKLFHTEMEANNIMPTIANTSTGIPNIILETRHSGIQAKVASAKSPLDDDELPNTSTEPLQSSSVHSSINTMNHNGSTETFYSGTIQGHITKAPSLVQTQPPSTESQFRDTEYSDYMVLHTDKNSPYDNHLSPDSNIDLNSKYMSPFTIETDTLAQSISQTPDIGALTQSPAPKFQITTKALGETTVELDMEIPSSPSLITKMRRSVSNTVKKQLIYTVSGAEITNVDIDKISVSQDEMSSGPTNFPRLENIEDSDLGWAANTLTIDVSSENAISTKGGLPVLSHDTRYQTLNSKLNEKKPMYQHVLQPERDITSVERENGVSGPNYASNALPIIETDRRNSEGKSGNSLDRRYLYILISCILGMLLFLCVALYLFYKNRILNRQLQIVQQNPEAPEENPLQIQEFEV